MNENDGFDHLKIIWYKLRLWFDDSDKDGYDKKDKCPTVPGLKKRAVLIQMVMELLTRR